jgi:hypothetical protein
MRNNHNHNHSHNQNKRMRGRNRGGGGGGGNKNHNPLTRVYESNGPDVKIRGTANHIAEKYIQLARDATASGDPVAAENYYQHAEHYFRLIAAAQEQFRQNQPFQQQQRPDGEQPRMGGEDNFDDSDEDAAAPQSGGNEPHYPREAQQPYPQQGQQNSQQPYPPRDYQNQTRPQHDNRPQQGGPDNDVGRLPSFITGGQPQPQQPGYGQNGGSDNQGDRFPLHRRRRRGPRGPRTDKQQGGQTVANDGGDDQPPAGPAGE